MEGKDSDTGYFAPGHPNPLVQSQEVDPPEVLEDVRKRSRPYPTNDEYYVSATNQVVIVMALGLIAAIGVGGRACYVKDLCIREKTCVESDQYGICSFTNRVTMAGDSAYNSNASAEALAATLRGVCSYGDRFQRNVLTGNMECVPYYPFPDALNREIMDPAASEPHMRACGRWIESGPQSIWETEVEHRSMEDHNAWVNVLMDAEDQATQSSRNAKDSMSKFRAECVRTTYHGSQATRNAATMAYNYLESEIGKINNRADLIRATGFLTGHHCDTNIRIGNYLSTAGTFALDVWSGWMFRENVLAEALQIVGEPTPMQLEAEEASRAINDHNASWMSDPINVTELYILISGAVQDDSLPFSTTPIYEYYDTRLLDAVVMYYGIQPNKVKSYMRGLAAFCSYSMLNNVEVLGTLLNDEITSIKASRAEASAIGRLATNDTDIEIGNETVINASTITLAQISRDATGDSDNDCLNFVRRLFPDHVDAARFHDTVHTSLYSRMESLTLRVRRGVAQAVLSSPMKDVLGNSTLVASDVAVAGIRIAGAPRGSWAGIARDIPEPVIASNDGLFIMGLKQAHSIFKDRIVGLSYNAADPCDYPPFSSSVTLNAYIIPSLKCSVLFLGMSKRPWLDAQYDDTSLLSRGLMVVAHELSHLTLNTHYLTGPYQELLKRYRVSTYSEAIADVGAALGVIAMGVDRDTLLMHWCQLWCARIPFGWSASPHSSHPQNNERCKFLHETIMEHVQPPSPPPLSTAVLSYIE
jgi:hypothetical protein